MSFIIERAIFYLDSLKQNNLSLTINIEKRGLKEDKKLAEHFQRILARGTGYMSAERMSKYHLSINFKSKKENINGLQFADLVAYPIARHILEPERINPAFDVFKAKFYTAAGKRYGLKIFP